MKTIFFANHAQFEGRYTNLGDWAIFEHMIEELSPYIEKKEVEVIVPSADVEFTMNNYPVLAFNRKGIAGFFRTIKYIIKSDVVVIGGGEIVQDRSSLVYIPYQLYRPFIGKLFSKKLFGYAIGVGEANEISWLGKIQARLVLNSFDVITVRDKKSLNVLRDYIKVNRPKIYLTADPALNLQPQKAINAQLYEKDFFVVSVRSVYHRNHNILPFSIRKKMGLIPKEYYKEIDIFQQEVAEIIKLLAKEFQMPVYFLNTYVGKEMSASDDKFTSEVVNKISTNGEVKMHLIDMDNTPSQIKYILGKSKFVFTVPLHPLILAASQYVPVFSMSYASKNKSFMEQINQEKYVYPVEEIGQRLDKNIVYEDIKYVMSNIETYRTKLQTYVNENKQVERNNCKYLLQLVEEA